MTCVPAMGVPVELNVPPQKLDSTLGLAPYSTKEGTATCGKTPDRYAETESRRLLRLPNAIP